ncbi:MAG: PorT family protein [Bacteroidaceae bacterium]|nr:PorT family protein [Bacteroidaceae bacterium]
MKKFFSLLIVLAMCSGNVMALDNEPEEGISFMGLFGMNVSKLQNHEYNAKVGATMGIRADYMLPNAHGTYLTAGVDWTMKGGKLSYSEMVGTTNVDATAKYALHYFEVPIRVGFRYNASDELGLYGEVGPYFAVGVGGKHKVKLDMDGDAANQIEDAGTYKAFRNYGYPDKTFQRWDAGIGFRVGAEYNEHYNLMLGCDWGLADIYRNSLRDDFYDKTGTSLPKVHNFNFSITLGYRF